MNREELYLAIAQVDEKWIDESTADIQRGRRRFRSWQRWAAAAACVALVLLSVPGLNRKLSAPAGGAVAESQAVEDAAIKGYGAEENSPAEAAEAAVEEETADMALSGAPEGPRSIISEPPAAPVELDYLPPENGSWFCSDGVADAVEVYADRNPMYELAVIPYRDGQRVTGETEQLLTALQEAGLDVFESEESSSGIAGYFTAGELEALTVPEDMGLVLCFYVEAP